MTKLTLTNVSRTARESRTKKDRNGNPLPYTSLSLKSVEYGEKFINGFGNKDNMAWKAGDVVEVEIKEVEKDGRKFLNFETPKKESGGGMSRSDRDTLMRIEMGQEQIKSGIAEILKKLSNELSPEDV